MNNYEIIRTFIKETGQEKGTVSAQMAMASLAMLERGITIFKIYRICTSCEIHHYENCEGCYGFGVYKISTKQDEAYPVSAEEAHSKQFRHKVIPCPVCGSTEEGYPK
jgi:hypothetical protein